MPTQINAAALQAISVNAVSVPPEGPVTIPLLLDFTVNSSFELDLQNFIAQNRITRVQGIFIDNLDGAAAVIVTEARTGIRIHCPTGDQVYAPLPSANPCTLLFAGFGGDPNALVRVNLYNYPVEPGVVA